MSTPSANIWLTEGDPVRPILPASDDGVVVLGGTHGADVNIHVSSSDMAARVAAAFSDLAALMLDREQGGK